MEVDQPVIVILNPPASLLINRLAFSGYRGVADDVDLVRVWPNEILQNGANDGLHTRGKDDGGNVVLQRPLEVLVEVWVELNVLD